MLLAPHAVPLAAPCLSLACPCRALFAVLYAPAGRAPRGLEENPMYQTPATSQRLAALMIDVERAVKGDFKRNQGMPDDLSLSQYQVLSLLVIQPQSMKDIATALNVMGPTVVRVVDALERKGLAQRARDTVDRRLVYLSLTDKGRTVQGTAGDRRHQRLAVIVDTLPRDTVDRLISSLGDFVTAATAAGLL